MPGERGVRAAGVSGGDDVSEATSLSLVSGHHAGEDM